MNPRTQTSAGLETSQETVDRIKQQLATAEQNRGASAGIPNNPLVDVLTERLSRQAEGISTSSSSNLQNSINEAISGTQRAGELGSEALQIERQREVGFARDRAGAQITGALEGRTGYATQVVALRELTETTEKSIRDLDQRYQQAIMQNDAATAQRVADLKMQKMEFLQQQEQNFYSNLLGVANLQQEAISLAQQSEQFYEAQQQQQRQFEANLKQSKYEFEQNYGLQLEELDLQEQQLELQRQRNNISMAEYQLRKQELNKAKSTANTEAIIAQDMKNKLASGDITRDDLLDSSYLALLRENLGFEGSTEELAELVQNAYSSLGSDETFQEDLGGVLRGDRNMNEAFTGSVTTPAYPRGLDVNVPAPDGFLPVTEGL